ncbi:cytochrome c oxidase, subunit VIa [Sphaerosporella brunnea]|uniref:Cytochrome c oxidase subunit n=1 Tax=Sphaerosporella brunnea TaxID=1250544 RepID=A0A5J5FCE3_9PEZI|nr:cytochrome c oxidase, subunit VIa [Sphaerosporella brunnea]
MFAAARVFTRAMRQPVQRRLNSTSSAANQQIQGSQEAGSAFVREREAVHKHAAESAALWRKLSLLSGIIYSVVPPIMIVSAINAWNLWNEHWEHWEHMPPLEERTEYPYQNIRVKNFFWGDGDKTLFWNDKVNYHKTE